MKKILIASLALTALTGCLRPDPAEPISTISGKNVYRSTCEVNQSALGGKALFGPNRGQVVTAENYCAQPRVTCPDGYEVTDLIEGIPELRTSTYHNGYYLVTQRYYVRETTVEYTCKA
ncbi:hypothetical protein BVC71_11875 [Marivivens niveibacter]|uniref:Lipoprotein n=1 Tax=Marivivens niveibacter TaxID=1930667 RepID=A0A251WVW2_9RHOB|nr:hypothetical protein [Marivivens niveibacter]OUD08630.1 hypothetical protein BVC71_11875 [Marivivens niveibacter]